MKLSVQRLKQIIEEELALLEKTNNEAMFQGNKRINPSAMSSDDMGPVQPIIDDFNRLCSMLQTAVESNPEAADLCDKINLELSRLADSLDKK